MIRYLIMRADRVGVRGLVASELEERGKEDLPHTIRRNK